MSLLNGGFPRFFHWQVAKVKGRSFTHILVFLLKSLRNKTARVFKRSILYLLHPSIYILLHPSALKEKRPLRLLCSQTAMRLKSGPRLFRISSPSFSRTERRFLRVSMSSVLEQCTRSEICELLTIQSKCPRSLYSPLSMVAKTRH